MARTIRFKLVFRRTNPVTRAAAMAAAVLSIVALVALYSSIDRLNSQCDAMRIQAMALESGRDQLASQIADLGTLESALRIAREELGLTFPDSLIYAPEN